MRINYKFLFNYLDDRLDASQNHELMTLLKEEPRVREMLDRLTYVLKNPLLQQPHGKEGTWPNANLVSTYLEGSLKGDDLKAVEDILQSDDHFLAHVATCHKVISGLIPIPVPTRTFIRSYELGTEVGATQSAPPRPKIKSSVMPKAQTQSKGISKNKLILMISGPMLMIILGMLLLKIMPPTVKTPEESKGISEAPKVEQENKTLAKLPEKKEQLKEAPKVEMKRIEPSIPITKAAIPIPKDDPKVLKMIGKANGETQTEIASLQEVAREKILLLHKPLENQPFTKALNPTFLSTSFIYMCLPGSTLNAEINNELQINFLGETRGASFNPMHVPCVFRFYARSVKQVDMALKSGRASIKTKTPATIIVRSWDLKTAWEVNLKNDSELVLEANTETILIGVLQGSCSIQQEGKEKPLPEFLAGCLLTINAQGETKRLTSQENNLLFSNQPIPLEYVSNNKALGAALDELLLALKPNLDISQAILAYILANNSNDARRNIGCLTLAALGEGKKLLELWRTDTVQQSMLRLYSIQGLKLWLLMEPTGADLLYNASLKEGWLPQAGYTPEQSQILKNLLVPRPNVARKQDYEELIGLLLHENTKIRELAYLQLRYYAKTEKELPSFLPLAQPASRAVEVARWQELLRNGFLPVKSE
ncbi:MAG: hypothetical protein DWH70_09440 [Planctomycetota bacterium]|nr:MAG: hypothetical protein DWH70_09440 [Planctomycetota bacterium]